MTQSQLDRAVAKVTGDSPTTIRRLGFQLLPGPEFIIEACPDGDNDDTQVYDWDVEQAILLADLVG